MNEQNQQPVEQPAPTLGDLNASEYREHREKGTTVDKIVEARPTPEPVEEKPAQVRDGETGRFTKPAESTESAKPSKEGNPRHDPKARVAELQAEIASLSRQRGETKAEREALAAEVAALKAERDALKGKPATEPAKTDAKPAVEKFTYDEYNAWAAKAENEGRSYEDYLDDRAEARVEHREKLAAEKKEHETREQRSRDAWTKYSERRAAFSKTHPDFDDLLQRSPVTQLDMPPVVGYVIANSEHGPALQYHLLQHPEEAQRIATLGFTDPYAALGELNKIEATFTSSAADRTVTAPATLPETQAAPPLETVGASASASSRNLETVAARGTAAEYRRLRSRE